MYISPYKKILDEAIALHQSGNLIEAKGLYESIINDDPNHFSALHLLGVIACQQNKYEEGIALIKRALVSDPRSLNAHVNLANAYEQIGEDKSAVICLAQYLEFEPEHQETLLKIVRLLQKLRLDDIALLYADKALAIKEDASIYAVKGSIFLKNQQPQDALVCFNKAIALKPDSIDAYANAGTACMMLNNPGEALHYYDRALALDPYNAAVKSNKELALHTPVGAQAQLMNAINNEDSLSVKQIIDQSEVLMGIGQIDAAIAHIQQAILTAPYEKAFYNQQGIIYSALRQYQQALNSLQQALAIDANYIQALINAALALMGLGQFEEAIQYCEKVLAQDAQNAFALNNIGSSLIELNQREQALRQYNHILSLVPEADYAKLNAAFCHLALGNYQEGLPLYEARWQGDLLKSKYYIPKPMWSGREPLKGKTIFLYGEQGYGDSLQFVRYVNLVAKQECTILLGVNDSIKTLFKRSFPYVELTGKDKPLPDLDYYCPLGSLPLAFNTAIDTIPNDVPYLISDKTLVEKWKKKLSGKKRRIGIVWRGRPDNPVEVKRAMGLPLMLTIARDDITLVNLKLDVNEDEALLLSQHNVLRVDNDIKNFDDTAAIIENLDLVITTDTSVAHLVGALGKPVWILLALSSDWRWHLERSDSPWYPSARLFRQPARGDWASVIEEVKANLKKWIT